MIQRIQSIYLFLVGVVSGGLVFLFDFWKNKSGKSIAILDLLKEKDILLQSIGMNFFLVALLAIISIFLFKDRKYQLVINTTSILINLLLLGLLAYHLFNIPGEMQISEKGIGSFLPLVSIVLLVLANRAIRKDENLVKSVDRLR